MEEKDRLTQAVKLTIEDKENFELLYTESMKKVYYWCYMIVKDETTAKDLAQEAMIKMYYSFDTLKTPETFNSWMYKLVRNLCYNYIRDRKTSHVVSLETEDYIKKTFEEKTPEYMPQIAYDLRETKKIITDFIENLPRKQREVVTLYYLEEFKIREIGDILGSDLGIIKSRLHSARKNLEKQIGQYEEDYQVKLYSTIVLPFFGDMLKERANELYSRQNFTFDSTLIRSENSFRTQGIKGPSKIVPITIGAAALSILVFGSVLAFLNFDHNEKDGATPKVATPVSNFEKDKSSLYIDSISRSTFPTNGYTDVVIHLKKSAEQEKVGIFLNEKPIPFEQRGQDIILKASENGDYVIKVGGTSRVIRVTQIDPNAPNINAVYNRNTYLELQITGDLSQIDYTASYIEYEGKRYPVLPNNTVEGHFDGNVKVYLYNYSGQYIYYNYKLN